MRQPKVYAPHRLRARRLRMQISQKALAGMVGVSREHLAKLESRGNPTSDLLGRLAAVLKVRIDYFFEREESK